MFSTRLPQPTSQLTHFFKVGIYINTAGIQSSKIKFSNQEAITKRLIGHAYAIDKNDNMVIFLFIFSIAARSKHFTYLSP